MARVVERGDGTMDGDGHNAKAFAWTTSDEEEAPAFDPAAVMRAIEDEDDEEAPRPRPAARAPNDDDLGAALRAALAFEVSAPPPAKEAGMAEDADAWDEDEAPDGDVMRLEAEDEDNLSLEAEDDAWAPSDSEDDDDLHYDAEDDGEDPAAVQDDPSTFASADAAGDGEAEDAGFDPSWDDDDAEDREAGDETVPAAAMQPYPPIDALDGPGRKPRIALMGEFSAGKSTLSNLLIGAAPLPMKVTATQLPPVWISHGDGAPYREDLDGATAPIDIARLADIDPAETRVIRIFEQSDVLEFCDIIDMPGISDPNMDAEVWERVIQKADAVIWCTHATQAWRQTEASVWESLDPRLHSRSILLVTRFDKIHGESDRARVMRRVERETEGLFAARLPISLTEALSAGEDEELLERSGALAFRDTLLAILGRIAGELGNAPPERRRQERTVETLSRDGMVSRLEGGRPATGVSPARILPRRIRPMSEAAPIRPQHGPNDAAL
jgi:hypothetical protein